MVRKLTAPGRQPGNPHQQTGETMRTLRVGVLLTLIALVLPGCLTLEQTRAKLTEYVAIGRAIGQQGAIAICQGYGPLAATFEAVAVSGTINATTVRDVRVAVDVLDTNCPAILDGTSKATRVVAQTYAILLQAAANARSRKGL